MNVGGYNRYNRFLVEDDVGAGAGAMLLQSAECRRDCVSIDKFFFSFVLFSVCGESDK